MLLLYRCDYASCVRVAQMLLYWPVLRVATLLLCCCYTGVTTLC